MPYRTLGLDEVAHYLNLHRAEVEQLVKDQEIPFERKGGRLVFRKVAIDTWASPRILGLEGRRLTAYHEQASLNARQILPHEAILPEMICAEYIDPALRAKTKASVLREMAGLAERTGRVWDLEGLIEGLQAREEVCSTGLPGGLALLHTRATQDNMFESLFLVLGRTIQQVPFGAPDGKATDLFFLLACPDDRLHLHALARICLVAQKTDVLAGLRQAEGAEEMYQCLTAAEQSVLVHK